MEPKLKTLSEVMRELGLTRVQFAELLGVPKWKLNNWTQLITSPSEADMARLTEVTGYSRDELHLKPLRRRGRPRKGETEDGDVVVMTTDRGRAFTVVEVEDEHDVGKKVKKVLW